MVVVYVDGYPCEIGQFQGDVQESLSKVVAYLLGPNSNEPNRLRRVPNGKAIAISKLDSEDDNAYVLDEPGWQMQMRNLILDGRAQSRERDRHKFVLEREESEESSRDAEPDLSQIDLPSNVITSIEQLHQIEFRPSIFGGLPDHLLVQAHAVERADIDDLQWIKAALRKGINFSKCSRKVVVEPRVIQSNPTFTVFKVFPREDTFTKKRFKLTTSIKKFSTSDIVTIVKGKASQELERTSKTISPHSCVCLAFTNRSLSMVLPSMEIRDRMCRGLSTLLGKPIVEQDDIL